MSATNKKKRDAQSPLAGDDDDLKRRIIGEDKPDLIALDEILDDVDENEAEFDLTKLLRQEDEKVKNLDSSATQNVESLIGRMDRFMQCFASLQASTYKNQRMNEKKFKQIESAHNALASKVANSSASTNSRIETLEEELKECLTANSALTKKVEYLMDEQTRQQQVNEQHSKSIKNLGIEQGFIDKKVNDCHSEVKERKMIISGVEEFPGENVTVVALGCLNKIIQAAIALKHPDAHPDGLRKLKYDSIDNVFRIGKVGNNRKRNISVTFMRFEDKEMVFRAKTAKKDDEGIRFFLNDDSTTDGRSLKSKLKRIVGIATSLGKSAKLSGNKVVIDSRIYPSNELNLLPKDIVAKMKQEKEIDDGIVYRGEYSTYSNFFPAPFSLDGIKYAHVEQYYQSTKALHHGDSEAADRIMIMSNPLRIKTLGDSIEGNASWIERRMLVLYDGVRAKFEQNLALQEELLATGEKHFYEATTDTYFGCGIGYESKKWQSKDWAGENVAGLIVKKVRDELLGNDPGALDHNNTLADLASQADLRDSSDMETAPPMNEADPTAVIKSQSDDLPKDQTLRRKEDGAECSQMNPSQKPPQSKNQRGRNRGRGRGKSWGRGRGSNKGSQPASHQRMTDADRNFLGVTGNDLGNRSRGRRSQRQWPVSIIDT